MNIYELLGLDIFSSEKEVDKKYEFYKEFIRRHPSNDIGATKKLIESEYEEFKKIGKQKYDRYIERSSNVVNFNEYKEEKSNKRYVDSGNQSYKLHGKNKAEKTQGLNPKVGAVLVIAGLTVTVCLAAFSMKTPKPTPVVTTEPESVYSFDYKVLSGDSVGIIEDRFNAEDVKRAPGAEGVLNQEEDVTVYTKDKALAEEEQKKYDDEKQTKEPAYFESYTIQSGDTLPEIAEEYGVTCQQIMDYNLEITDIRTIYAGNTIKIPVYNQEKVK